MKWSYTHAVCGIVGFLAGIFLALCIALASRQPSEDLIRQVDDWKIKCMDAQLDAIGAEMIRDKIALENGELRRRIAASSGNGDR